jgi:hypothetical protein
VGVKKPTLVRGVGVVRSKAPKAGGLTSSRRGLYKNYCRTILHPGIHILNQVDVVH